MTKETAERAVTMTQNLMEQYFNKNSDLILSLLHPDVVWIGAAVGQYHYGYPEVSSELLKLTDIPRCTLTNQEYQLIFQDTKICVVAGTYIGYTLPESQEIFSARQRVTFVWIEEAASLKILHMHISNPLEFQEPDENFPHKAGSLTYKYMQKLLKEKTNPANPLQFRGKNAEIYFYKPNEIVYVEADNICCTIYTALEKQEICQPLSQLSKILPKQFLRIHRSFIVNRNYIAQLSRYKVRLKNGTILPVPEKKYKQVQQLLEISFK